jgi:hypothetical protein
MSYDLTNISPGARVRELIEWTNPQSWEAALQEASLRHTPGTGEWLFHETSYQIWKSKIGVCSDQGRTLDTNKNVLLVQGLSIPSVKCLCL